MRPKWPCDMISMTIQEACGTILHALAEKLNSKIDTLPYEGVLSFRPVDVAPSYYSKQLQASTDVELTDLYHSAFRNLSEKRLFEIHFNSRLGAYDKLSVSCRQAETIYHAAGIIPKIRIAAAVKEVIFKHENSSCKEVAGFIHKLVEADFKGFRYCVPKPYADKICEERALALNDYRIYWENVLHGAEYILSLRDDVLIKNLSKVLYGDSKALERYYISDIVKIIDPMLHELKLSDKDVLAHHKVFAIKPVAMIRGMAEIVFDDGQTTNLSKFHTAVPLSEEQISSIVSCNCSYILTVENPTTFATVPLMPETVIINTVGYADNVVMQLVNKLIDCSPATGVEHFGDLDPHGFKISKDVATRLKNGTLSRRWMDAASFPRYIGTEPMKPWQYEQFTAMLDDPYYTAADKEMIRLLLSKNVVAEQEGFTF